MNSACRLLLLCAAAQQPAEAPRPNVVLIVADDLGYGDLSIQGGEIPTPSIDSIAAQGIRFTQAYSVAPVCSPSRAGLLTGRYPQRFGFEMNVGPSGIEDDFGLPVEEVTLATRLRTLGYRTGAFGKWHVGYEPKMHPLERGFEEFFGFLGGAHSYLEAREADRLQNPILRGRETVDEIDYLTRDLAAEAIAFIERHEDEPFFVYLPFNAVHTPLEAPESYLARFAELPDPRRRTFAAVLTALDDAVGRVLRTLHELELEDETLVLFLSDNGGPGNLTGANNAPLRGNKGQLWEGGIRVPFLARWPGRFPAGIVDERPISALDVHPTVLAAAGGTLPADAALDGVDLLPTLRDPRSDAPRRTLFWRFGDQVAVRVGDWKLLRPGDGTTRLHDLARDPGEEHDLASEQPEKLRELDEAAAAWLRELSDPRWSRKPRSER